MRGATIVDMPTIMQISREAIGEEANTYRFYENLRKASHVFLSDSGDSYCTYYPIQARKYQMHITSVRGVGKDIGVFLVETAEHMLGTDADVILGFTRHRGLKLLMAHMSRGRVPSIDLPDNERMYVMTKDKLEEMKRCLKQYQ